MAAVRRISVSSSGRTGHRRREHASLHQRQRPVRRVPVAGDQSRQWRHERSARRLPARPRCRRQRDLRPVGADRSGVDRARERELSPVRTTPPLQAIGGDSVDPAISGDGRYVAFHSAGDESGGWRHLRILGRVRARSADPDDPARQHERQLRVRRQSQPKRHHQPRRPLSWRSNRSPTTSRGGARSRSRRCSTSSCTIATSTRTA